MNVHMHISSLHSRVRLCARPIVLILLPAIAASVFAQIGCHSYQAGNAPLGGGTAGGATRGAVHANQLKQQYPALYDEDLPYNGLFYGLGFSADQYLATPLKAGADWAGRFRATRTGTVTHISWQNRWDWSDVGAYSVGDGGRIFGELRADDGSNNHYPGALLATTQAYIPTAEGVNNFVQLALDTPVAIEAGKLYHIVMKQSGSNFATINHSKWVNCTSPRGGPYYGNDSVMLEAHSGGWRTYGASSVSQFSCAAPYFRLTYSDGVAVSPSGGWSGNITLVTIGRATHGRERFTVSGPDRRVTGVWTRIRRRDASPLIMELKDASGAVLMSTSVPAIMFDGGSFTAEGGSVGWKYIPFQTMVPLQSRKEYTFEIHSSGSFDIQGSIDLVKFGHFTSDLHLWTDGVAELSRNSGKNWTGWPVSTSADNKGVDWVDLPFLFTLEGGPKEILSVVAD
jgi:hypothetical protein